MKMEWKPPADSSLWLSGSLRGLADFKSIIHDTSRFLSRHGIYKNSAISDSSYGRIVEMGESALSEITLRARRVLDVHLELEKEGYDLDDSKHLARVALGHLGLLTDEIIFKSLRRSDIVEIYNTNHIQIFRSFNFFRICNYNLDEILLNEWYTLYERDEKITCEILTQIEGHLRQSRSVTRFSVPAHIMRERFSSTQGMFITKFKVLASVFDGPESRAGFLCTIRGRPISASPKKISFLSSNRLNR
ncbi:MAG: hypothetical protein AB7G93_15785 [Bdellovibrionales bacterium]